MEAIGLLLLIFGVVRTAIWLEIFFMTWRGMQGDWHDGPVPQNECDFYHLVRELPPSESASDGTTMPHLRGTDAPTGQWGMVMGAIIRYARLKRVVELGVWKGGTTVFLADACRDTGGLVIAIDREPCWEARERLQRLGLASPYCHFYQGHSHTVQYDGRPIDLLFIDAGHQEHEVRGDWERWTRWVKKGGWVFMDNSTSEAGVMEFMSKLVATADFGQQWQFINCPQSYGVAVFRKRECSDAEEFRRR